MSNIFDHNFQEYIQLLNEHEVEYILVGGMAVNIHGYRRTTGDMDLFVNPTRENHLKLSKVHRDFEMHMGEMEDINNFLDTDKYDVYTFGVSPIQIDVMTKCKGIDFKTARSSSIVTKIEDHLSIVVINYNDLIKTKKATNRLRDQVDIQELGKIKKAKGKGFSM
jgi:hypothetical protein